MDEKLILSRISRSIHEKDPKAEAYLFGSRARGDNRADSDWDIVILVDAERVTNEIDDHFRQDLYKLEVESGQIISILVYPKLFWNNEMFYSPLRKNVLKEGIRL